MKIKHLSHTCHCTSLTHATAPQLDVDLSQPHQWYPIARGMHRTLHLHIGPTNSGKTHTALESLGSADSGWYAGT